MSIVLDFHDDELKARPYESLFNSHIAVSDGLDTMMNKLESSWNASFREGLGDPNPSTLSMIEAQTAPLAADVSSVLENKNEIESLEQFYDKHAPWKPSEQVKTCCFRASVFSKDRTCLPPGTYNLRHMSRKPVRQMSCDPDMKARVWEHENLKGKYADVDDTRAVWTHLPESIHSVRVMHSSDPFKVNPASNKTVNKAILKGRGGAFGVGSLAGLANIDWSNYAKRFNKPK